MQTASEALSSNIASMEHWANRNYSKRKGYNDLGRWIAKEQQSLENQLALLDYENEYNSDPEKASRMREAGLNPDLLGVQGSSESADFDAGLSDNVPLPSETSLRNQQLSLNVVNALQGSFQTALDAYSKFQDIRSKTLQNDMSALRLEDMSRQTAQDLGDFYFGDNTDFDPNNSSNTNVLIGNSGKVKGLSKRQNKRLSNMLNSYINSKPFKTKTNETETKYQGSRQDLGSVYANPMFSSSDKDYFGVLKGWQEMVHSLTENTLYYQNSKAFNDRYFQEHYDPRYAVGAQMKQDLFNYNYYKNLQGDVIGRNETNNSIYSTSMNRHAYQLDDLQHRNYLAQKKFYDMLDNIGGSDAGNFGYFLLNSIPNGINLLGSAVGIRSNLAKTAFYNRH